MISREFATALFTLCSEESVLRKIADELTEVSDILKDNRDYVSLLSSPAIAKEERISMIESAFSGFHEYTISFLKLLCDKRAFSEIFEIIDEYLKLFEESNKISEARVITAFELTEEEKNRLTEKLEKMYGHTVIINEEKDASLLGGMIIEIDGKVIDASLRHQINELKDVIKQ